MIAFRRPPWWALLLTAASALLFLRLGAWQLDRADVKEQLLRRYAASASAPVQPFASVADAPPTVGLARVMVRGQYQSNRIYLLDNPRHDGRGGVQVYVPLAQQGDPRLLLVDLGFLPGNGTGQTPELPALSPGDVTLEGLYLPPPSMGFKMGGNALAQQSQWPKTTIYLDLEKVADDLGQPLYPHVLALPPDPASAYVRQHTPDFSGMPPARNRAYAFQWFSFALAVVVILLVLNRKRTPRRRPSHPPDSEHHD